ncbi:MAG: glycerol kinase GlpK [Verrucomicrobiota bacterium]|nr:glycerol kinase GlpK [Verrucomicrobiota bacterium]
MPHKKKYILALDQGTTSSRAIVFNSNSQAVAISQKEFPQLFPKSGWVEHDPEVIWKTQLSTAKQAIRKAKLSSKEISGIGITNQRETTVIWDRTTGKPIANAIVWQDRRTSDYCESLRKDKAHRLIRRLTGLELDAYFSATKIRWLLKNIKGAKAKAQAGHLAFGTIDTWLIWKLTGGQTHITDVSNASRTMLFNIETGDWDDRLLELFQIPRSMMPAIVSSSDIYDETSALGNSIPIAGIAGDQQAALFGQGCHRKGMVKCTYGTGCFLLMHTGNKPMASKNRLLTTVAWKIGSKMEYALEGSVFTAGAAVQWLRDQLGIIKSASDIESLANQVTDNGGVHFVPAFTGLGAPYWNPYARGIISGLSRGASNGHIARAALEGIAFQVYDVIHAMSSDANTPLRELRVDGGASQNDLLMQIQSNLLQAQVIRPTITETTALGAAYLAGLAVNVWKDKSSIKKNWKASKVFKPKMNKQSRTELLNGWKESVKNLK